MSKKRAKFPVSTTTIIERPSLLHFSSPILATTTQLQQGMPENCIPKFAA
jgi:hypothetical protein